LTTGPADLGAVLGVGKLYQHSTPSASLLSSADGRNRTGTASLTFSCNQRIDANANANVNVMSYCFLYMNTGGPGIGVNPRLHVVKTLELRVRI